MQHSTKIFYSVFLRPDAGKQTVFTTEKTSNNLKVAITLKEKSSKVLAHFLLWIAVLFVPSGMIERCPLNGCKNKDDF